jgi:hypothetical protein
MSDQGNRQEGVAGDLDHPVNRAGPGEGVRAPFASETGVSEISVFDGAGNEQVVRTQGDASGQRVQGTGDSSAEAAADAEKLLEEGGQSVGEGFQPVNTEKSDVNP